MQSKVVGDIEDFYPEVMISYATGTREGKDANGCGPGMYYWCVQLELVFRGAANSQPTSKPHAH